MSHVVKTIKIKRGAKMHILANGAGRNLRSTITNHFKIRIMKEQILKKIERVNEGSGINAIYTYTKMIRDLKNFDFNIEIVTIFVVGLSLTPTEVEFLRTQV